MKVLFPAPQILPAVQYAGLGWWFHEHLVGRSGVQNAGSDHRSQSCSWTGANVLRTENPPPLEGISSCFWRDSAMLCRTKMAGLLPLCPLPAGRANQGEA